MNTVILCTLCIVIIVLIILTVLLFILFYLAGKELATTEIELELAKSQIQSLEENFGTTKSENENKS